MNDIFRKRNMYDNTRNSSGFETRNIETVHYGSETIVYLGTKIRDFVPQKIKDLENIHIFKLNMKFWKSDNFPCHLLKLREVSQYGIFSGLHFLVFGLNLRSHSVYKKIRTRKNSVFAHFSRSVNYTYHKSGFFDISLRLLHFCLILLTFWDSFYLHVFYFYSF